MYHITLDDQQPDTHQDVVGRANYGWNPDASLEEMWEDNRQIWRMARKVEAEGYVIFAHDGKIVMVGTIDRVVDAPKIPGKGPKRSIEGKVLRPGDLYHDVLVGKTTPFAGQSHRYVTSEDVLRIAAGMFE